MQQGTLVVREVTRMKKREFSARVVRRIGGQETPPRTLHLTLAADGKARDQHGKLHDWKIFEPYLRS